MILYRPLCKRLLLPAFDQLLVARGLTHVGDAEADKCDELLQFSFLCSFEYDILNYFHFLHSTKNTANVKAKKSPRRDAIKVDNNSGV